MNIAGRVSVNLCGASLIGVFLVGIGTTSGLSAERARAQEAAVQTGAIAESDEGFRAQFNAIVHAGCSGESEAEAKQIEQLRLPHAAAWFEHNFDPAEASKLTIRYEQLAADYSGSVEKTIRNVCETDGAEIVISQANSPAGTKVASGFKLSATRPIAELPLFRFRFTLRIHGADNLSWAETFVYEQGLFRFVGGGTRAFWEWEEGAGPGIFKNGHSHQALSLIYQVAPVYPPDAKAQHIEGVVVIRALIDKQGNVKKMEVIQGHPLLVDAARDAVMQWRYKPATIGGQPAEADTNIRVEFRLPNR
jgi:TonB family protein